MAFPHSKTEGLLGYLERKITDKTNDKAKEAVFQLIEFILVQRAWKVDVDRFCIGFKACHLEILVGRVFKFEILNKSN